MILDELGGQTDGVLRRDGAVGPYFQHQPIVVGHLAQSRGFHGIIHLAHRRVHGVHRNVADGQVLIEIAVGAHVSAAILDAHFELQLATFAHRGDVYAFVQNRKISIFFDHGGSDHTRSFRIERDRLGLVVIEFERHLFEVQDNIRGVFHYAGNRAELMQHTFDLDRGNRGALNRTEQRTAQRIAHRCAPAALKGLRREFSVLVGQGIKFGRQPLRFLKALPHFRCYPSSRTAGYEICKFADARITSNTAPQSTAH